MLQSRNKQFGFYGTMLGITHSESFTDMLWDHYMERLVESFDWPEEKARDFLDSTNGRYLADSVEFERYEEFPAWLTNAAERFSEGYNPVDFAVS